MKLKNKKGFTLSELLIVISIIAILAGISIPVFSSLVEKAKNSALQANCRSAVSLANTIYLTDLEAHLLPSDPDITEIWIDNIGDGKSSDIIFDNQTLVHLTYTEKDKSVTYCRFPEECMHHPEIYNFNSSNTGAEIRFGLKTPNGVSVTVPTQGNYNKLEGK
ncbi:type II secretion system GspH family protein, partial [Eubacteriales bacterium OttesenSCG-928-G02]|nr:type II secretion system GspH family protein [Eubacteriales bacterium OttesenSCG-928-G02]